MNRFTSLVAFAFLASVVGCAATSEESQDVSGDELTARPAIQLKPSTDSASIAGKLYGMLEAFKGDSSLAISSEVSSFTMKGAPDHEVNRSVSCTKSNLVHATLGQGVTTTTFFGCTLEGFDKVRNGGQLPLAFSGSPVNVPLAANLFSLLSKAEKRGGFDVKKSGGQTPPCCDIPTTTTMSISDDSATFSCSLHTGGFAAGMANAECTYVLADAKPSEEVEKGTLIHTVGIGGENTGFSVKLANGSVLELVLDETARNAFVQGRVARVTGTPTTLSGVETHNRPAIKVSDLLVCPAPHTTFSMMPPVTDDANWMGANCPDLDIVH
jgi:hypothetical protein